jgi:hypothetical protein
MFQRIVVAWDGSELAGGLRVAFTCACDRRAERRVALEQAILTA